MSDGERKIRRLLSAACGMAGYLSPTSRRELARMLRAGEVSIDELRAIGGEWLEEQVREEMKLCST